MNSPQNIVGNVYDKYHARNPIARWLMSGFLETVGGLVAAAKPATILEVGCGEGWLADHLVRNVWRPQRFSAVDLSAERIAPDLDPLVEFRPASIYELPFGEASFDLVLCCEVLEHLDDPIRAMAELSRVTRVSLIVSTPREPLWRVLNMARGKYWSAWGNTPGHVQHFSRGELRRLVEQSMEVVELHSPAPWTVIRAIPRRPSNATG